MGAVFEDFGGVSKANQQERGYMKLIRRTVFLILFSVVLPLSVPSVSKATNINKAPESDNLRLSLKVSTDEDKGKPIYKFHVALSNIGDHPIKLNSTRVQYLDPPNAGLLEVSAHYALNPNAKKCSMRQTFTDWEYKKLSYELTPGETITEEWQTNGIDLRSASFEQGDYLDGGICLEPPGQYTIKLIAFFIPDEYYQGNNEIVYVESNEQPLLIK
jgi:hypothetical protein